MKTNRLNIVIAVVMGMVFAACGHKYDGNMQYRTLGSTGIRVSEIGIGCGVFENLGFEESRQYMELAIDSGINYMDLYTANPDDLDRVGYALKGHRDDMVIQGHIGNWWNPELKQMERTRDVEKSRIGFDDMLQRLGTDQIEVGLIFMSDDMEDWDSLVQSPFMDYCQELVRQGKVGHLGMSSHNAAVALAAAKSGMVEVIMFSLNPAFDLVQTGLSIWDTNSYKNLLPGIDPVRTELYNYCAQHDIAIVVMKAFGGGGRLLDADKSPLGFALTTNQCLAYALSNPAVKVALCGTRNIEQLVEDLQYLNASEADKDFSTPLQQLNRPSKAAGDCTYCGHCTPCPVNIDIAAINRLLDQVENGTPTAEQQQAYDQLEHHASECVGCGACEKRCPFDVPIRDRMAQAVKIFGK